MKLNLTVRFTAGRYHGQEFPPSPARLFQAMIAGSHRGGYGLINTDARDDALKWLEHLAPPVIEASKVVETSDQISLYLPNNDDGILKTYNGKDKKPESLSRSEWANAKQKASSDFHINLFTHKRSSEKSMRAFVLTGEKIVRYVWTCGDTDEDKKNAQVVCAIAALVTSLGHGLDEVFAHGKITHKEASTQTDASNDESIVYQPRIMLGGDFVAPCEGSYQAYKTRYERTAQEAPRSFR